MQKIIRMMVVRYDTLRSKSNILNICNENTKDNGELVFLDKTDGGWVSSFLSSNGVDAEKLKVIRVPLEDDYVKTVATWGKTLSPTKDHWVQVLAEDDAFIGLNEKLPLSEDDKGMLICPVAFLYKDRIWLVDFPKYASGFGALDLNRIFKLTNNLGDTVWYALIRADIFYYYCRWLSELPIRPWHVVNQAVWTALAYGKVGRIPQFLFAKDHENWLKSDGLPYESKNYQDLYGNAELYVWDESLILLSSLAHLIWLRKTEGAVYVEYCIFHVLRLMNRPRRARAIKLLLGNRQEFFKIVTFLKYRYLYSFLFRSTDKETSQRLSAFNNQQIPKILEEVYADLPAELTIITDYYLQIIQKGISTH